MVCMHTFLETLSENAQFVLLCLGITAVVLLLAWVSEKLVMRRRHRLNAAHTITTIAMLAAISGVLMVIEIPLFFAPSFYKLDFSELPVLICAFYLGPVSGVVCEFLKVLLKLLLKGTSTAFVGDLANFLVGCSFVLPAAIVYQKTLSKKGAVVSLAVGTAVMTTTSASLKIFKAIRRTRWSCRTAHRARSSTGSAFSAGQRPRTSCSPARVSGAAMPPSSAPAPASGLSPRSTAARASG